MTAMLDHPSSEETTVSVSVRPVAPAVATDYTLAGSQLTIAAGATESTGEVTITGVNNVVDAPDKEVTVRARATNSQGVASHPADVTLTITDDEGAPELRIGDASVVEGDTGSATMTFTVRLSPASSSEVTVDWATSGGDGDRGDGLHDGERQPDL